ncbi:hypothetical protein Tco_1504727 [Tanacetum coccineum]
MVLQVLQEHQDHFGCPHLFLIYLLVHPDLLSNKAVGFHVRRKLIQSMAWTTSDTRFELTGFTNTQESSPTDSIMHDDFVPDEQNNWANALVSTYETSAENSLLAKTRDITTFINSYCQRMNKTLLTQVDFEGQAYEVVKAFYPDVIHLQFQMEECHKMLTDQINWANSEDLEYLRYGNKGIRPVLSISNMKAASYPDFGLELLMPEQMWIEDVCTYDKNAEYGHLDHLPGSDKRMLSTAVKLWTRNLVIRHRVEDFQLSIESYQTQLNLSKLGWDAKGYEYKYNYTIIESPRAVVFSVNNNERKIMRFNEIYKFSDGTLTRILEALDYRVKEFKLKRLNPSSYKDGDDVNLFLELNGIPVALMARFGVVTKSTDRILVFYRG